MNENLSRMLAITGSVICAVVTIGITSGFGIGINTNLFNTGLQANIIVAIVMAVIAWALYQRYI